MPIAQANNIDIWYETFGDKNKPAILLIMGACSQGILWPTDFCQELSDKGYWVIRYDHRDTGYSTCFDYVKNPYDLHDMAQDAIGLLRYLSVKKAHLVGLSLGGPIAELVAVEYINNIDSITLIATSCDFRPMNLAFAGLSPETNALSRPIDIYLNWMKKFLDHPPRNINEHIELRLEGWRILSGFVFPFEEKKYYELHKEFLRRTRDISKLANHIQVCNVSEKLINELPMQVKVPTLILHGTEDPIVPADHGKALNSKILGSKYIIINGMGHIPHKECYKAVINNIDDNCKHRFSE